MKILPYIILVAVFTVSCSPYQKVLKSEDTGLKFHYADSLYNTGKYKKALKLMEQIVPAYRGKPQGEKLMYLYSDTFYNLGDHYLSGYQFERFVATYPDSEKAEEARVSLRNTRHEVLNTAKDEEKNGELSKDDVARTEKQISELMDEYNAKIEEAFSRKEAEIMTV